MVSSGKVQIGLEPQVKGTDQRRTGRVDAKELTASVPNLHLLYKLLQPAWSYQWESSDIRGILGSCTFATEPASFLVLLKSKGQPEALSLWALPEALSLCSSLCPGDPMSPSWGSVGFSGRSWVLCWSPLFTKGY